MRSPLAFAKDLVRPSSHPASQSAGKTLNKTRTSTAVLDIDFRPDIPTAGVIEQNLQDYDSRNWRKHFSNQLKGKGLEIGPLHRPMVRHPEMQVDYIDRYSTADLRAHYPELKDYVIVEPDILGDAETLSNIADGQYDFLISAHVIEHMRNPLGALKVWRRVIKPGGLIYLIVPDKRVTFDLQRVRTTLPHIIFDYFQPSLDRDFEHFLDYSVHVHKRDGLDALREAERLRDIDYSIHFHVFLPSDIIRLLNWFNENVEPLEIVEGPSMAPGSDEFHLLLRRPT